jgi:hypothetical protein
MAEMTEIPSDGAAPVEVRLRLLHRRRRPRLRDVLVGAGLAVSAVLMVLIGLGLFHG